MVYLNVLAETRTGAFMEIMIMLIVAAAIGFITAWLYYRSVCNKKLAAKQAEIDRLNKLLADREDRITSLEADLAALRQDIEGRDEAIRKQDRQLEQLRKELGELKALHDGATAEIAQLKQESIRTEQDLVEKDAVLTRVAQKKHLLDYDSFGKATAADKQDLKLISGIGPFIEQKLNALDIFTFAQIASFSDKDVDTVTEAIEFFPGRIERDNWIPQAKELMKGSGKDGELLARLRSRKHKIDYESFGTATREEADDLTRIKGIGPWIQEKLYALDIFTFRQIGNFTDKDIENVTEVIEFFPGRIQRDKWVGQAKELAR
jgi:predicted flap endonuclease-1-like 5' DNA nuclease